MFFYVDEGGNTGLNLFDPDQTTLSYGVLSSPVDLDAAAVKKVEQMRVTLGVPRIHAKDLGNEKLVVIAPAVLNLLRKLRIRFDFYKVRKPDLAVTQFFDQVFDSGMNEAVRWSDYWTPQRYALLLRLAGLFDEETAKAAWQARIEGDDAKAAKQLRDVCVELISRCDQIPELSVRQRVRDGLTWAAKNPSKISYNASSAHLPKKQKKTAVHPISPNIIGFQFVMQGIARRLLGAKAEASRIIVDQQAEFNDAQRVLAEMYAKAAGIDFANGPGLPKLEFDGMPNTPVEFVSGDKSAGLELVDVMLWIHRRLDEKKPLAGALMPIYQFNAPKGETDELSINGLYRRWGPVLSSVPDASSMSPEQLEEVRVLFEKESARVKAALQACADRPL